MEEVFKLLDHGSVKLIETWGSDERIIEAARMSTDKGFVGWGPKCPTCDGPIEQALIDGFGTDYEGWICRTCNVAVQPKAGDEGLLRYLYEHKHATPFEMAGMVIEVEAPIMVFREWHRHRTQSFNELSGRYTQLPDRSYVPTVERMMRNAGTTNKQAGTVRGSAELTEPVAVALLSEERAFNEAAERFYQKKLAAGVPKELARTHIGVSRYSRMRASANLRNWLAFLTLRDDAAAQWEIQQYAKCVDQLVEKHWPRTHALYVAGRSR